MTEGTLGFVGVGRMGSLMVPRLIAKGYDVVVYDKSAAALEKLADGGAQIAKSAREVASRAGIVLMSLPTPDIVHTVAIGEIAQGSAVKRVIDVSTTGP